MSYDKTYLDLNNKMKMPIVGLGTWKGQAESIKAAVKVALDNGYRHIDTAFVYMNEKEIGEVLTECISGGKIKREDLFIVTKLPVHGMRPGHVRHFLDLSLKNLQLDYVDLYLVHSPFAFQYVSDTEPYPLENGVAKMDHTSDLVQIWKKMEEMVDLGLTKSIGVSNFSCGQVMRILDNCRIKPVTNQVECHPYLPQRKLQKFCEKHAVTITAYAPIGSPALTHLWNEIRDQKLEGPMVLDDPVVKSIGNKYQKTSSQVLLRWLIQRGISVIPKSVTPSRIKENFDVFDFKLSSEDVAAIDALDRNTRYFTLNWLKGVEDHPEHQKWIKDL